MDRILRFLKWAARSERRNQKPRRRAPGVAPYHRQLVCEPLEARTLLSVSLQPFATAQASSIRPLGGAGGSGHSAVPSALDPTPNQVRGAYGLGSYTGGNLSNGLSFAGIQGDGRGQTIALIDAYDYPTALTDANAFSNAYGLPTFGGAGHPTFTKLNQNGGTTLPGTDPAGPYYQTYYSDWEGEEALDVEWAHAMAPMANIILFEAYNDSNNCADLFVAAKTAANTPGVVAVSMSWGIDESGEYGVTAAQVANYDSTVFVTPSGHLGGSATLGGTDLAGGVTFLASAGDSGAYSNDATTTVTPSYPATSPNVVSVGGTALTTTGSSPNYSWSSEVTWGDGVNTGTNGMNGTGELGGGGGGISAYESQPAYQNGVVNAFSTTKRTYPDVSAEAAPGSDTFPTQGVSVYDSYDDPSNPWSTGVGGTSLSCPMWAGMIAVADEGRAIAGEGSLDGRSQTLPDLYSLPAADFHDITSGNAIGPSPEFSPKSGYDLATGRGSPVGNLLIPGLVAAPPTVTGISPTSGPSAGGITVTITGTNFSNATAVNFGATAATNVQIISATQITAISPAEAAGTVNVTVASPSGTSTITAADQFTYSAAPAVTGISPVAGPLAGSTAVTITGVGFSGATTVDFGLTAATNVVVVSPTQITATSPAEAAGTVDVTVTEANGTSAISPSDQFSYVGTPTVTLVNPATGPAAGGTPVVITGTFFSGATTVKFGSTPATNVIIVSATQITATSPAGAAGTVDVTITGPGGTSAISPTDKFVYVAAPTVTLVNPTTGPTTGGTSVTITGTNLTNAIEVAFGSTAATITSDTANQIVATSPVRPAGMVDVTVVTAGGTSATSSNDQFTYFVPAPTVTGVSPTTGPTTGNTTVTITGTNLEKATAVNFGSIAATITSDTVTQIVVTSPVATAGLVNVTVVTAGGTSATSSKDQFTYFVPAPTVTGVSPTVGPVTGGTSVTITGTNLANATGVKFGSAAATTITSDTATQIVATSPAEAAGTVNVTVVTAGGTSATLSADQFSYVVAPVVTGVSSPASGAYAPGTPILINVTFSESVLVNTAGGTPQLALSDGGVATYTGGSGTATLTFTYAVTAGQTTSDLDYTSSATSLGLNGATIQDAAGNAAVLTLPTTGTDGLAAQNISVVPLADGLASGFSTWPWQLSSAGTTPANWTIQQGVGPGGSSAAQSGAIGASSSSTLSVTLTVAAGELSFWREVSSASGNGSLIFKIDNGPPQLQLSSTMPWQQSFCWVSAGQHTFSWTYSEAAGSPGAGDAAWLSGVQFTPGTTLTVNGTQGKGQFTFDASGSQIVVTLNGESHSFNTTGEFTNYVFHGGGSGTATLTGGSGANSAMLYANGNGQLNNAGYAVAVDGMATITAYGHAGDVAQFFDSSGSNTYYAYADGNGKPLAGMYGGGYSNVASGFATNLAYSSGNDAAIFFDSPGANTFYAYADANGKPAAGMYGSYSGYSGMYSNAASGFATNLAYAINGGTDAAVFVDAPGANTFYAYADYNHSGQQVAGMYGTGYSNAASGFATNIAYATNGSNDTASFYDAPGANTFYAYGSYNNSGPLAGMYGAYGGEYSNVASGFGTNVGIAGNGSNDAAGLYTSSGNSTMYTDAAIAELYGSNYTEEASGFTFVSAIASGGGVDVKGIGPVKYQLSYYGSWVGRGQV